MKHIIYELSSRLKAYLVIVLMAALMFSLSSCGDDDDGPAPPQTIVDVAVASGYNTLAAALTEAGLVDDLQAAGPFTVFAPTDAAFADAGITASNVGTVANLEQILLYHVVLGEVRSTDLSTGTQATLNTSASLTIDADNLTVNGIDIISPFDVEASNGIIHTIDGVLLPPAPLEDIVTIASGNDNLTVLEAALTKFPDLVSTLSGSGSFTVFAPTDAAFTALLGVIGQDELDDIPESVLRRVLEYHVVAGTAAFADDLSNDQMIETVLTEEGAVMSETVTIGVSGSDVTVNGANVTTADVEASNGVVHIIDAVLVPAFELSIVNTIVEPAYFNVNFTTLTGAVVNAGLLETLTDTDADLTLFAPDNTAFDGLIADLDGVTNVEELLDLEASALSDILTYHVLDPATFMEEVFAEDLPATGTEAQPFAATIPTLNGDFYLTNNSNGVFINGSTEVVGATSEGGALDYDNGVVHLIDQVLRPVTGDDIVDVAIAAGFSELAAALTEAGLVSALQGEGPFTVFAPNNQAFEDLYDFLGADVNDATDIDDATLEAVLKYHVINGARVFSSDLSDGLEAATFEDNGTIITINVGDDGVSITDQDDDLPDANVDQVNILTSNGVIHVIDAVLLPVDL
ncbi:MAG: fasciclin domain-containing protein [Bacteroidota bacterium]